MSQHVEPSNPSSSTDELIADWEFRAHEEREQFQLYERRRSDYEGQATAVTAAAITLAALLVAGQDRLAKLGDAVKVGISVAIVALVVAVICSAISRFSSWAAFERLERRKPRRDRAVGSTLEVLRSDDAGSGVALRERAYEHWRERAESAWQLGKFKQKWLKYAGYALTVPLAFLVLVAVALLS